jgi:hypothetical protein
MAIFLKTNVTIVHLCINGCVLSHNGQVFSRFFLRKYLQNRPQEFMSLVGREGQRWFWTGGRISGQTVSWPNGVSQNAGELRSIFSHTGG